jgi:hypothetical protein
VAPCEPRWLDATDSDRRLGVDDEDEDNDDDEAEDEDEEEDDS